MPMGLLETKLKSLNDEQRKAVDKIDGPVMVVAGPGTGKTELLALRAANILKKDQTILPSNILCLTFTETAADNLRERLIGYIGQDAYKIGVYTFHSFGAHIMSLYPEYFFAWRETKTADSLTTFRLLEDILSKLPGDHELAGKSPEGAFYAMRQLINFIGDAKKANLTPEDLKLVISDNQKACEALLPKIRELWPPSMTPAALDNLTELVEHVATEKPANQVVEGLAPFKNMVISALGLAAAQSLELEGRAKTKPFTAFKDAWLVKDEGGQWIFAIQNHISKLMAATEIYEKYQKALSNKGLADFSDQISWVLRALGENKALRLNLQERYQYIMIDEFQDTNRPQLMMARYLTEAGIKGDLPNILVVGDDDQAIFRFQGADIANIGEFEAAYPKHETIVLKENYRSAPAILDAAERINRQIELSLAKQKALDKSLRPAIKPSGQGIVLNEFSNDSQHYAYIAEQIKSVHKKLDGKEIAVLARERSQLDALMPYLRHLQIPVNYERRENVLDQEHILTLVEMARLVNLLAQQKLDEANSVLPKVLSEPMWALKTEGIWQISLKAYKDKALWLEEIYKSKNPHLKQIADFFVELGASSLKMPVEQVLDKLIGTTSSEINDEVEPSDIKDSPDFKSPFKDYFFGDELREEQPIQYLTFLSHMATLRRHLRNYQTGERRTLLLSDFVDFFDSYNRAELSMLDNAPHNEDNSAVQLMTIHGAKGLEFDSVFVIGLQQNIWTKSGSTNRFSYPANLQEIKASDNQDDDGLRLLFVAMTRAKQNLYLNYFLSDEEGKSFQPYAPLLSIELEPAKHEGLSEAVVLVEQYEQRWLNRHLSLDGASMKALLSDRLAHYRLSATHLNNFIDVSSGGPLFFLTQNLLNFPSGMNPAAIYGTAMHTAITAAHEKVIAGEKVDIDKLVEAFVENLSAQALSPDDKLKYIKSGTKALRLFLKSSLDSFNKDQKTEVKFDNQGVSVSSAMLAGNVDLVDLSKEDKRISVTDYKTGGAYISWNLPSSAKEYSRIKLHKYRQQLLFYKILVDGSNDYGNRGWTAEEGKLVFVEAGSATKIKSLTLNYELEEIERAKKLIMAVWQKIQNLDFEQTKKYPPTYKGILQFENDLIESFKDY